MALEIIKGLEELLIMDVKGKTLAVVGNAEMQKEFRKEINNHDEVIRFNDYKLEGYENEVGTKTTIWCNRSSNHANVHGHDWCINSRNVSEENYRVHIKTYEPERDYDKIIRFEYGHAATTGMLLLYVLDKLQIHSDVYGFDFMVSKHYYSEKPPDWKLHKPGVEREIFSKLRYACYRGC